MGVKTCNPSSFQVVKPPSSPEDVGKLVEPCKSHVLVWGLCFSLSLHCID